MNLFLRNRPATIRKSILLVIKGQGEDSEEKKVGQQFIEALIRLDGVKPAYRIICRVGLRFHENPVHPVCSA